MKTLNSIKRLTATRGHCGLAMAPACRPRTPTTRLLGTKARRWPECRRDRGMSLEGRLSILDFVYRRRRHERIYAIVGSDGVGDPSRVRRERNRAPGHVARRIRLCLPRHADRPAAAAFGHARPPAAAAVKVSLEGTLKLLHADNFEGGTSRFIWELEDDDGGSIELDIPIAPTDMKPGMRIAVTGTRSGRRQSRRIRSPRSRKRPQRNAGAVTSAQNASVLVILLNFQPTPPAMAPSTPFTQAARGSGVVFSGAEQHRRLLERSLVRQPAMTGHRDAVADGELPAPATCDYHGHRDRGTTRRAARGLQPRELPENPSTCSPTCRLAAGPGSAKCPARRLEQPVQHARRHRARARPQFRAGTRELAALQRRDDRHQLPAGAAGIRRPVGHHGQPERALGQRLAEERSWAGFPMRRSPRTPAAPRRTRSRPSLRPAARSTPCRCPPPCIAPTGSNSARQRASMPGCRRPPPTARSSTSADSCTSPDRSEYGCWDTCFLDMVPGTGSMTDGALQIPNAFVDAQTGVTITAVSKGAGGLTVSVASPQTHGNTGIYRKVTPSTRAGLQVPARLRVGPGRGREDPARHGRRHSAGRQFHQRRA